MREIVGLTSLHHIRPRVIRPSPECYLTCSSISPRKEANQAGSQSRSFLSRSWLLSRFWDLSMEELELKTAPADFRFPTTNQTKHCFTRYIEFHKCVAAKGEDSGDCQKFAKYYRSLCPAEWIGKWNEQRDNGTFPGPL